MFNRHRFPAANIFAIGFGGIIILSSLTFSAAGFAAQSAKDIKTLLKDIYRIEMVVFRNRNTNDEYGEQWDSTPELSYPEQLIFLRNTLGDYPEQFGNDSQGTASTADAGLVTIPPLMLKLPSDTHLLKSIANAIGRRSAHDILFHQAWHQSLGSIRNAPAIPIAGGQQFDNHHELEGSIKLSKGRFLHITSDLWLTQYSPRDAFGNSDSSDPYSSPYNDAINVPVVPLDNSDDTRGNDGRSDDTTLDDRLAFEQQNSYRAGRYRANRSYVLREYRKMKRNATHYLDHPMFSIVIQITKYEAPKKISNPTASE